MIEQHGFGLGMMRQQAHQFRAAVPIEPSDTDPRAHRIIIHDYELLYRGRNLIRSGAVPH